MERLCTLNTATLLTRTHLTPKPVQNTLSCVYKSLKVTHFGITEKLSRDCVLQYNNISFRVGNFEGNVCASKISRTPPSFGARYLRNPSNICTSLIFLQTRIIGYIMPLTVWVHLHSNFSGHFPRESVLAVQGHQRSLILVPIESAYATSY